MTKILELTGDWAKLDRILSTLPTRLAAAEHKAVLKEANFLRGKIIEGFNRGGWVKWAPHSPLTLAIRRFKGGGGGSKLLVASGALRGSAVVIPLGQGVAFVGVRRKSPKGANIAQIHEEGRTWSRPMTARQRRFLFAALRAAGLSRKASKAPAGGGVLTIRIPARPFIAPVLTRFARPEEVRSRFMKSLTADLGGDIGRV